MATKPNRYVSKPKLESAISVSERDHVKDIWHPKLKEKRKEREFYLDGIFDISPDVDTSLHRGVGPLAQNLTRQAIQLCAQIKETHAQRVIFMCFEAILLPTRDLSLTIECGSEEARASPLLLPPPLLGLLLLTLDGRLTIGSHHHAIQLVLSFPYKTHKNKQVPEFRHTQGSGEKNKAWCSRPKYTLPREVTQLSSAKKDL